ncbi:MAG: ROK family protein [Candidatus Marinimicrobia bacterium]|jgi:hypothetical protein|nr:ROK family protein [Candidatus Neomarinimicrobiota bacterium]MBT3676280.1 ROK family protein [Candidatus Neomarinimicrobiota bacterium]MBT3762923.1 ROK family protein [Candidatus Neomarinimicrobiota bacterium]MBT4067080.1 ROK family protein [Candidatus Neomarinimicrobiota bacterium]MBT4269996.1 ROK family protein [Candidatus Neomarinimicrobiota bacterium]
MRVIGIDGGATKVSGGIVEKINANTFKLNKHAVDINYGDHSNFNSNFSPLPLDKQFEGGINSIEQEQGLVYIDCVLEVIQSLAKSEPFRVAIAMPGIKTEDGRGIAAMANGPRIPDFCDQIQKALNLEQPIKRLESDADMCVWGEEFAEDGALQNVENGYYIGGGTGTADGLKLKGKILPFDDAANWIAKSIELKMPNGQTLESYASMSGINILRESKTDSEIGLVLGDLLFERISTIYSGWKNPFSLSRELQTEHSFQNTLLDRIVIGQRLSEFLQSDNGNAIKGAMVEAIKQKCTMAESPIVEHYLLEGEFNQERIVMSNLRAAPIIGLGAKVWKTQC